MTNGADVTSRYPREVVAGSRTLTLRLMTPADRDAILTFARSLPPNDLLFLRLDITQPEGVDEWVRNIEANRTHTVLAIDSGAVAGYASVHHNDVLWNRHVGELRVMVGSEHRRHGLGRRLTDEVVSIARALGLQKLTVQMTPDQRGARATFERLGFRAEALLADYVVDNEGRTRDLLVMSHDVSGFTNVEHLSATGSARS
ncbi:MAG: GNAT family N-acetyltransferase [Dehalococcoidia bacterium]